MQSEYIGQTTERCCTPPLHLRFYAKHSSHLAGMNPDRHLQAVKEWPASGAWMWASILLHLSSLTLCNKDNATSSLTLLLTEIIFDPEVMKILAVKWQQIIFLLCLFVYFKKHVLTCEFRYTARKSHTVNHRCDSILSCISDCKGISLVCSHLSPGMWRLVMLDFIQPSVDRLD